MIVPEISKADHAFDWVVVRAIAAHLFEYARRPAPSPLGNMDIGIIALPIELRAAGPSTLFAAQQRIARRRDKFVDGSVAEFELNA